MALYYDRLIGLGCLRYIVVCVSKHQCPFYLNWPHIDAESLEARNHEMMVALGQVIGLYGLEAINYVVLKLLHALP